MLSARRSVAHGNRGVKRDQAERCGDRPIVSQRPEPVGGTALFAGCFTLTFAWETIIMTLPLRAKPISLTGVSLLLWPTRRCCVAQARMMCLVPCNVRIAARMAGPKSCLASFSSHTTPHRSPSRQSSPTRCYFAPKATLYFHSESNFAVVICLSKTVRMRGVVVCLRGFRTRQHSNNGFGVRTSLTHHVIQGPETASRYVAVENIPCP